MSAPDVGELSCNRPAKTGTCIERLADGWILPADLCPPCMRAFMAALDGIAGPMVWHPNYLARAER